MSWKKVELKDICKIKSGKRLPKGSDFSSEVTNYPYIRARDIKNGSISSDDLVYLDEETHKKISKYIVNTNDIVITVVGASVGDVGFVKKEFDGFNLTENAIRLTDYAKTVSPRYLLYILNSKEYWELMQQIAGGSAQPKLGIYKVESISAELPPINTQIRIADILSAYDDLIENNQKQIKLLEEAAQRLYKEWFVDFRFPGHENTTFVDGLPEGWEYLPIKDAFSWIRGKSYTSLELSDTEGVKLVNLKNIKAFGGYNRGAEKRFTGSFKQEQLLQPGDVVMGVTDMTKERRLVGHVAIIPDLKEKMTFSMDLIKLLPNRISKCYLYSLMFFGGYSKKISPLANGTNVLHLKPEAMNTMSILIPNKVIMTQYDDLFTYYNRKIEMLEDQIEVLKEARDRLLPKLMNGEIEI